MRGAGAAVEDETLALEDGNMVAMAVKVSSVTDFLSWLTVH
jgi:hypothetical protein